MEILIRNYYVKLINFPKKDILLNFNYDQKKLADTSKFWIKAQEQINQDKKIRFFKTHNIFGSIY